MNLTKQDREYLDARLDTMEIGCDSVEVYVDCPECDGAGTVEFDCPDCLGTGIPKYGPVDGSCRCTRRRVSRPVCPECHGTGAECREVYRDDAERLAREGKTVVPGRCLDDDYDPREE